MSSQILLPGLQNPRFRLRLHFGPVFTVKPSQEHYEGETVCFMMKHFCTLTSWSIFWRALLQQVLLRLKRISCPRSFPQLLSLEASMERFKSSCLNLKALLSLPHPTECNGFHKDPESSLLVAGHRAISIPSVITG